MKLNEGRYEIVFMSKALGVTSQGYYHYLKSLNKPYKYELLLAEIKKIIQEDECNDMYGSMRMYQALKYKESIGKSEALTVPSERTVYRVMKKHGLIHTPNHKPNSLTKSDKAAQKADDLIKRDFTSDKPMTKAVTDMTEIPTADGKLYVSAVFDCYDLMPIGLSMANNMRAELSKSTIEDIITRYGKDAAKNMLIHSDRGSQYTSELYKNVIKKYKICQSMNSASGRCHDNARCESIWGRMKEELLYNRYNTKKMSMETVRSLVWRYFMGYWTNRRICTAIGGIPPIIKRNQYYESLKKIA